MLSPGERLSHYEILAEIGAGGMGRVYRARDTRLAREVAIKVSAEKFSERFEREARVIASLNHPNICTLYDVGPNYLVMELVEGASPKGPLPLDTALDYARQMAAALDYAHEKGVTHRDLKPANIKITPDGQVKLLDFGLAKRTATPNRDREGAGNSPTLTMGMTEAGMILGTAAYMSPEQARGKEVDRRADIWSFGVVLYELITGKRLFQGEDVSDILASVLKEEPKFEAVPEQVRPLLQRCLEKDPKKRLRDMGDAMALVGLPTAVERPPVPSRSRFGAAAGWLAAALLALVASLAFWAPWRAKPPAPDVLRFQIPAPEGVDTSVFALSPDGRHLAFLVRTGGKYRIWVRSLDTLQARELPGTETAGDFAVFWSPDSRSIAFNADGNLKKVDLIGGPPQTIAQGSGLGPVSGAWNRDGVIIVGNISGPVMRVSASGGQFTPVTQRDASAKDTGHMAAQFLPDGRHFLYVRPDGTRSFPVFVGSLDLEPDKQSTKPISGLTNFPGFVPSTNGGPGTIVFLRQNTLMAQPFDLDRLELTGEPAAIADSVDGYGVSASGVVVYTTGAGQKAQLTWFDRQGKMLGNVGDPAAYGSISLSPDNSHAVAVKYEESGVRNLWLLDLARNNSTRFTFTAGVNGNEAVWSADGSRVVFAVFLGSRLDFFQKPVNETSEEKLLLKTDQLMLPSSWSPDGRFLLYFGLDPKNRDDIWVFPLEGEQKPVRLLGTEFFENWAYFSPDGHRIAYVSDESGREEVYVRPFLVDAKGTPSIGPKTLASKGGGNSADWRKDGKELIYISPERNMMAVEVSTNPTFPFSEPKVLFKIPQGAWVDSSTDHQRFLMAIPTAQASATAFTVVVNWQAGLRK